MTGELRFGICTDQNMPWDTNVERWRYFENLGFDSLWVCDHFMQPSRPDGPYFEGWTLLAGLAAVTDRARIGVLVSSNTFRHPALLAKEAMTVDHLSNGRLEVGLGAGWYLPEHQKYGIEFPETPELVGRFREAVEIIDLMLRQEVTTYNGRYYQINEAPMRPLPVQKPRPPIMVGAKKPKMLELAARYADTWNSSGGSVEEMRERNEILNEACDRVGRDPSTIVRSLYGWASVMPDVPWQSVDAFQDVVGRYTEAGINEFIIDQPPPGQFDVLERVATEVIPGLRSN